MARLTLGDQVSIVSTGEKGTIVGESNGLYESAFASMGADCTLDNRLHYALAYKRHETAFSRSAEINW